MSSGRQKFSSSSILRLVLGLPLLHFDPVACVNSTPVVKYSMFRTTTSCMWGNLPLSSRNLRKTKSGETWSSFQICCSVLRNENIFGVDLSCQGELEKKRETKSNTTGFEHVSVPIFRRWQYFNNEIAAFVQLLQPHGGRES